MSMISRDGGIRTRGLLLPNQYHPDAAPSPASPGIALTCNNSRRTWPDVAWYLWTLAPTLAPT